MAETRTTWTDERLDDLNRRVDTGFTEVHADLRSINSRMDEGFRSVNARMDEGFHAVSARIDSLQRQMIQLMGGTIATVLATLITVVLTRA